MVLIPPGEFMMGSSEEEIEELLKEVEETGDLEGLRQGGFHPKVLNTRSESPDHSISLHTK